MQKTEKSSKMIISDLDRTLLTDDNRFSPQVLNAMQKVREEGYVLVIATGRNIFSSRKVLETDLAFDYLIFSSGAGIIDWQRQEIIYENHLEHWQTRKILNVLLEYKVDFMVHEVIPENHKFYYCSHKELPDFVRRRELYREYAQPLRLDEAPERAAQFLAILHKDKLQKFNIIKRRLPFVKVIRATSPLDHSSIWLEVFPKHVSKGKTAKWLCDHLTIPVQNTIGIGNDYNDVDLLDWTNRSFVVENAPEELQKKYDVIPTNQDNGFAEMVRKYLV